MKLKYFLGVEIARSKKRNLLYQKKYVLDLLAETKKLGAKPCDTPMVPNVYLIRDDDNLLDHQKDIEG